MPDPRPTANIETALQETTCIVSLHVHQWGASKTDRKLSREVTSQAGAEDDAAKVVKALVPKETLQGIQSATNALRNNWRQYTSPWMEGGARIMSTADDHFEKFLIDHAKLEREFNDRVQDVADRWDEITDRAPLRMAELWSEAEFPTKEQFIGRFSVSLGWSTTAPDWRADLSEAHAARIAEDVQRQNTDAIEAAMGDAWARLFKVVEHMAARLGEYQGKGKGGKLYESVVTNVQTLCKVMDGLNITQDPELSRLTHEVCNKLTQHDVEALKDDDLLRRKVAADASALVDAMKSAYGG